MKKPAAWLTQFLCALVLANSLAAPAAAASTGLVHVDHVVDGDDAVSCEGGLHIGDERIASSCETTSLGLTTTAESAISFDDVSLGRLRIDGPHAVAVLGAVDVANDVVIRGTNIDVGAAVAGNSVRINAVEEVVFGDTADVFSATDLTVIAEEGSVAVSQLARLSSFGNYPTTVEVEAPTIVSFGSITAMNSSPWGSGVTITAAEFGGTVFLGGTIDVSNPAGRGGAIRVIGESVALLGVDGEPDASGELVASGSAGGGNIIVGGDHRGESSFPNSYEVFIGEGVELIADAVGHGNGGDISIWADGEAVMDGLAAARGGVDGGDGGFIEVSAGVASELNGTLDVTAINGTDGDVLLDPLFYAVLPDGLLTAFTAVDDVDAVTFLADLDDSAAEYVPKLFCSLAGAGCATPTMPTINYTMPIQHKNTIIDYITDPDRTDRIRSDKLRKALKKLKPRKWVSFLSKSTLEQFTGNVDVESLFGVTLLHGLTDLTTLGIPGASVSGTLNFSNQGPGESVRFATPYNVTSNGDINVAGADLILHAGMAVDRAYIEQKLREILGPDDSWAADALSGYSGEQLVNEALAEILADPSWNQEIIELAEFSDLMCDDCVPDIALLVARATATPYTADNLHAMVPLYNALGIPVPQWYTNFVNNVEYLNNVAGRFPGGLPGDVTQLSLDGVAVPGVAGAIANGVCQGTNLVGLGCFDPNDLPYPGNPAQLVNGACAAGRDVPKPWPLNHLVEFVCDSYHQVCPPSGCWITPPNLGTPWDLVDTCNGVAGFVGGECWADPPGNLLGICGNSVSTTVCSIESIVNEAMMPAVEQAVLAKVPTDFSGFDDFFGPLNQGWPFPDINLNPLPALLYVDGTISNPSGTVVLRNESFTGHVVIDEPVIANFVEIDAENSDFINRQLAAGDILGALSFASLPSGNASAAALKANTILSDTDGGFGETEAPIRLEQLGGPIAVNIDNSGSGGVHVAASTNVAATGTINSLGGHVTLTAYSNFDLSGVDIDVGDHTVFGKVDGGSLTFPNPVSLEQFVATGLEKNDTVTARFDAGVPTLVDLGDGVDTLNVNLNGATPIQAAKGTLSAPGFADITYSNVEHLVGVAPTLREIVAEDSIDEGDVWTLPIGFIDWGADSWTVEVDWGDGTSDSNTHRRSGDVTVETMTHVFADNGIYTATITVTDDQDRIGSSTTVEVTVENAAPVVTPAPDTTNPEGSLVTLTPMFTDAGSDDTHLASIYWGDFTAIEPATVGANGVVTASHVYADDGEYETNVCVTDDDGASHCRSSIVTITNVDPTVVLGDDQNVDEGEIFALETGKFNDLGTLDTHAATVRWGDGQVTDHGVDEQPFGPAGDVNGASGTFDASHGYVDNGVYTVEACVLDDDDGVGCDNTTITVDNLLPTLPPLVDLEADEGALVELTISFGDEGAADTHTATIDWGDGSEPGNADVAEGPVDLTPGLGGTFAGRHVYADNGEYIVTVCIADDDATETQVCDTFQIAVENVLPTSPIFEAQGRSDEGSVHSLGALTFVDQSPADTFTATVDWGDGSDVEGIDVIEVLDATAPLDRTLTPPTHTFVEDGVYAVEVCVADDDQPDDPVCGTTQLTVDNVAPQNLRIRGFEPIDEGSQAEAAVLRFVDVGAADTHTATIDWNDGSELVAGAIRGHTVEFAPHTYVDDGTYLTEMCVADDEGAVSCIASEVTVINRAPTFSLTDVDHAIDEGDEITVGLSNIIDVGVDDVLSGTITWGDEAETPFAVDSTALTQSHTYDDDGAFLGEVCVRDGDGGETCHGFDVVAENVAPIVAVGQAGEAYEGGEAALVIDGIVDPGADDVFVVSVNWRDGTSSTFDAAVLGQSLIHQYAADGTYLVEVCIADDDGGNSCTEHEIVVENAPPTITALSEVPGPNREGDPFTIGFYDVADPGQDDVALFVDWGNGAGRQELAAGETFDGLEYIYEVPGSYAVELCAVDSAGAETCKVVRAIVNQTPLTSTPTFWVGASILILGAGFAIRKKFIV